MLEDTRDISWKRCGIVFEICRLHPSGGVGPPEDGKHSDSSCVCSFDLEISNFVGFVKVHLLKTGRHRRNMIPSDHESIEMLGSLIRSFYGWPAITASGSPGIIQGLCDSGHVWGRPAVDLRLWERRKLAEWRFLQALAHPVRSIHHTSDHKWTGLLDTFLN